MTLTFAWDPDKAATNLTKHGISFEEATTVFDDKLLATRFDEERSSPGEERLIAIGQSRQGRILVGVHRDEGADRIRIISARRATPSERENYEEGA